MPLLYNLCSKAFASCNPFLTHLRLAHALHNIGSTVNWGQDSCPHSFQSFHYFKYHLEKHHSHLISQACGNVENKVSSIADNVRIWILLNVPQLKVMNLRICQ